PHVRQSRRQPKESKHGIRASSKYVRRSVLAQWLLLPRVQRPRWRMVCGLLLPWHGWRVAKRGYLQRVAPSGTRPMSGPAILPRGMLQHKPPHGSPCNSCGACCFATRCQIGVRLFGPGGKCPAVVRIGPTTWTCGIVQEVGDAELRAAALLLIR